MLILIPIDKKDQETAQLVSLNDVKAWGLLTIKEGRLQQCQFYDNKEDISDWIDCVVVVDNKEYVWPFMEENIAVLVAPRQRSIEDIVEAFIFKELHDLNI